MSTWLIDIQPVDEGVAILMAAQSTDVFSPQLHIAVGLLPLSGVTLTSTFKWFIPIKTGPMFSFNEVETVIHSFHFIISGWEIILYDDHDVIVVSSKFDYHLANNV